MAKDMAKKINYSNCETSFEDIHHAAGTQKNRLQKKISKTVWKLKIKTRKNALSDTR